MPTDLHSLRENCENSRILSIFSLVRQKRRNGEDVYDLKAVCKIRDPWPQPWIKVKNRRGLSGLIESKVRP